MVNGCEHKYIYMDSKNSKEDRLFGAPEWKKIDFFYCEKCLEERSTYKYECGWERPDWY